MKRLGMPQKDLFDFAIINNMSDSSVLIGEVARNITKETGGTELWAQFKIAREEAILTTVASMIAENNRYITEQLEVLGILPHQD